MKNIPYTDGSPSREWVDDQDPVDQAIEALSMVSNFNWRNNRTHLLEIVDQALTALRQHQKDTITIKRDDVPFRLEEALTCSMMSQDNADLIIKQTVRLIADKLKEVE